MDVGPGLASQLYATARSALAPKPAEGGPQAGAGQGFAEAAATAASDAVATLRRGEQTAEAGLTGGADPQSVVQALAEAELAVEAAVTVRDRVVEAYQEILRMPV